MLFCVMHLCVNGDCKKQMNSCLILSMNHMLQEENGWEVLLLRILKSTSVHIKLLLQSGKNYLESRKCHKMAREILFYFYFISTSENLQVLSNVIIYFFQPWHVYIVENTLRYCKFVLVWRLGQILDWAVTYMYVNGACRVLCWPVKCSAKLQLLVHAQDRAGGLAQPGNKVHCCGNNDHYCGSKVHYIMVTKFPIMVT